MPLPNPFRSPRELGREPEEEHGFWYVPRRQWPLMLILLAGTAVGLGLCIYFACKMAQMIIKTGSLF